LIYNTVSYFIFRALGTLFGDLNIADPPSRVTTGLLMLQIPAFTYLLDTDFRFNAMLCSNLGNENYNAGHTKISRGSHLAQMR